MSRVPPNIWQRSFAAMVSCVVIVVSNVTASYANNAVLIFPDGHKWHMSDPDAAYVKGPMLVYVPSNDKLVLVQIAAVSGRTKPSEKPDLRWKIGESCAYSTEATGFASEIIGTIVDIKEMYDSKGRTVGVIYVGETGHMLYQANLLMSKRLVKQLNLKDPDGYGSYGWSQLDNYGTYGWSLLSPYDPVKVPLPVRECLLEHRTARLDLSYGIQSEIQFIIYNLGLDFVPYIYGSPNVLKFGYVKEHVHAK